MESVPCLGAFKVLRYDVVKCSPHKFAPCRCKMVPRLNLIETANSMNWSLAILVDGGRDVACEVHPPCHLIFPAIDATFPSVSYLLV